MIRHATHQAKAMSATHCVSGDARLMATACGYDVGNVWLRPADRFCDRRAPGSPGM